MKHKNSRKEFNESVHCIKLQIFQWAFSLAVFTCTDPKVNGNAKVEKGLHSINSEFLFWFNCNRCKISCLPIGLKLYESLFWTLTRSLEFCRFNIILTSPLRLTYFYFYFRFTHSQQFLVSNTHVLIKNEGVSSKSVS